jgi:hypothetical protein
MQAGGPPDGCCRRLLTLSFKQLNEGPLNYYFDDPEHSRDNGDPNDPKPGDGEPLSQEDQAKMRQDFIDNPDQWTEKPGNPNRQTFQRMATFCNGSGKIEHFGS